MRIIFLLLLLCTHELSASVSKDDTGLPTFKVPTLKIPGLDFFGTKEKVEDYTDQWVKIVNLHREDIAIKNSKIASKDKLINRLVSDLDYLTLSASVVRKTREEIANEYVNQISDLNANLSQISAQKTALEETLSQSQQQIMILSKQVEAFKQNYENEQTISSALKERFEKEQANNSTLTNQLDALKKELVNMAEDYKQNLKAYQISLEKELSEKKLLQASLELEKNKNDTLTQHLHDREKELTESQEKSQAILKENKDKKKKLKTITSDFERSKKALETTEKSLLLSEKRLEEEESKSNNLSAKLHQAEEKHLKAVESFEIQVKDLHQEKISLANSLLHKTNDYKTLETSFKALKHTHEEILKTNHELENNLKISKAYKENEAQENEQSTNKDNKQSDAPSFSLIEIQRSDKPRIRKAVQNVATQSSFQGGVKAAPTMNLVDNNSIVNQLVENGAFSLDLNFNLLEENQETPKEKALKHQVTTQSKVIETLTTENSSLHTTVRNLSVQIIELEKAFNR